MFLALVRSVVDDTVVFDLSVLELLDGHIVQGTHRINPFPISPVEI